MAEFDGTSAGAPTKTSPYTDAITDAKTRLGELQDKNTWIQNYIKLHTTVDSIDNSTKFTGSDPEVAYAQVRNLASDNLTNVLAKETAWKAEQDKAAAPNKPPAQTPDQAAITSATAADAQRLAKERADPTHPGQTNQEFIASQQAKEGLTSLEAQRQLTAQTALIDAQYKAGTLNIDQAKFAYQKIKDQLDAQVAANDKEVAAKLAQQKHDETIRSQDIAQRDTDANNFASLTNENLKDFIPAGSMGDYNEIVKGITTPGYTPQLTGSIASHPFNAASVAAAQMLQSPAHIQGLGAAIASNIAGSAAAPGATVTAPAPTNPALAGLLSGIQGPAPAANTTVVMNNGQPMVMAPALVYNPDTGFVPGG